jgi:Mrp family chromosome partitioning ATPase
LRKQRRPGGARTRDHAPQRWAATLGSVAELESAVSQYQRAWWQADQEALATLAHDHTPDEVEAITQDAAAGMAITTRRIYAPGGDYLPQRRDLHARLVGTCVPAVRSAPGTAGNGRSPRVFVTVGCPSVGKSTVLRNLAL